MCACAQGSRPPAALKTGLQRSGESSLHVFWHTACTSGEPCTVTGCQLSCDAAHTQARLRSALLLCKGINVTLDGAEAALCGHRHASRCLQVDQDLCIKGCRVGIGIAKQLQQRQLTLAIPCTPMFCHSQARSIQMHAAPNPCNPHEETVVVRRCGVGVGIAEEL